MAELVVVWQRFTMPGGERGGWHPHGVASSPITPLADFGAPCRPLADFDAPGILPPSFPQQELNTWLTMGGRPVGDDRPSRPKEKKSDPI